MEENPDSKYMPHDADSKPSAPASDAPKAAPRRHPFLGRELQNTLEEQSLRGLHMLVPESTIAPENEAPETPINWKKDENGNGNRSYFWIVLVSHVVSLVFSPFYLPAVAFVVLFAFSYLNMLPMQTKVLLTIIVYFFTILLPHLTIYIYRKINGWTRHQLGKRERRYVPYVLSITSYAALLVLFYRIHMPRFTLGIIVGALAVQVVCALVNSLIKVSTHAAASAGVVGALLAFSLIFNFDPTWWLCFTVLLCGMVSTARLILRQHTLREIGWGVVIGFLSGFLSILLV